MIDVITTLMVNDMDEYKRVLEFVNPDHLGASFDTDPETLSFSWSGADDFKWLELSREEQQRMLDEVRDSILEDNSVDLPF